MKKKLPIIFAVLLLVMLAMQCFVFAKTNGQTLDEPYYSAIGYPIARYGTYKVMGEHPPLMTHLAALPLLLIKPNYPLNNPVLVSGSPAIDIPHTGNRFLYEMGNDADKMIFLQRLPIIAVTMILGSVLFLWAEALFGPWPAVATLAFFTFCPNILSHGSLNTTDLGACAFFFFALYRLRKLLLKHSFRNALFAGILSGLALLTKISTLVLIPVSFLLFTAAVILRPKAEESKILRRADRRLIARRRFALQDDNKTFENAIVIACILLMVLTVGQKLMASVVFPLCLTQLYLFWKKRRKAGYLNRLKPKVALIFYFIGWTVSLVSAVLLFKKFPNLSKLALALNMGTIVFHYYLGKVSLSSSISLRGRLFLLIWLVALMVLILGYVDFLDNLIRLKPFKHYLQNFLMVVSHSERGHHSCIPGSFVTCDWKYFPALLLIKLPVGTLVSAMLGLLFLGQLKISRLDKAFLIIPPLFFLLTAATASQIHIGIRHGLLLFPFLFLIAGGFFSGLLDSRLRGLKALGLFLCAFLPLATAGESLANFPHHLSFFNAFVGSPEAGAKLTGDSNFNWGQDNRRMIRYVLDHQLPEVKILNATRNKPAYDYHKIPWKDLPVEEYRSPSPGPTIVDVQYYQRFQQDPGSWFYGKQPKAKIGQTLYLFEVS